MKKLVSAFAAAVSMFAMASSAQAADYLFDVEYDGNGIASLAPGSADPLAVILAAGDTYTYRLSASGTGYWTKLADGGIFPFFSLSGPFGTSTANFTLNLLNNGSNVFTYSEMGATTAFAHLGTNTVSVGAGLVWDQFELTSSILSTEATGPANSLLPWPGQALEQYRPQRVSFTPGAVPEPATWALMVLGVGLAGAAMRRKQQAQVRFAF